MALRNTLLVVAASAASGTVAYKAASSYQETAKRAVVEAKGAGADRTVRGSAEAKRGSDAGEAETLVLNLKPGGFARGVGAKLSLTFSVDLKVKGGDVVEGISDSEVVIEEDGEVVSADEGWRRFSSEFPEVGAPRANHRLLLDLSGSMTSERRRRQIAGVGGRYIDKVLAAKDSGKHFIAIDGFDGGKPVSLHAYSQDGESLKRALANPCVPSLCNDPSTNLHGALDATLEQLEREAQSDPAISERAIVVVSDGVDQAGTVGFDAFVKRSEASEVHLYAIGLGRDADLERLGSLGKAGSVFWKEEEDEDGLRKAADGISIRTIPLPKHFYRLDYCSPKRAGSHELTIKIRHRDEQKVVRVGSLSQEFEAGGETFECDLPRPKR